MIIDADTHISPTGEDANAITIDELLRRMDRARVDKALAWLRPPYLREIDESNAYVHQAVQQHSDRILGFGWADPRLGLDRAKDAVKRCIEDYGFYGVKLNGAGRIIVDAETQATSRKGVFAGGDVAASGGTTIVKSVAEGKRAGLAIDEYLRG